MSLSGYTKSQFYTKICLSHTVCTVEKKNVNSNKKFKTEVTRKAMKLGQYKASYLSVITNR